MKILVFIFCSLFLNVAVAVLPDCRLPADLKDGGFVKKFSDSFINSPAGRLTQTEANYPLVKKCEKALKPEGSTGDLCIEWIGYRAGQRNGAGSKRGGVISVDAKGRVTGFGDLTDDIFLPYCTNCSVPVLYKRLTESSYVSSIVNTLNEWQELEAEVAYDAAVLTVTNGISRNGDQIGNTVAAMYALVAHARQQLNCISPNASKPDPHRDHQPPNLRNRCRPGSSDCGSSDTKG
ncbi:MAG: hypothetical protein AAF203_05780 [Pseudomonadota bacterium]